MPELPSTPIPDDEALEIMTADLATLSEAPDVWEVMFALLDRAIETLRSNK